MASYASYQQHSMGFNSHEFNFPPYTCDAEQSYLPATTCDDSSFIMGYPQQGYSHNMNEPYPFNPEQLQQLARYDMNQQHSQLKADYSFEHQPPVLSSTSDSGASIQSAMSSNMGSPSAQPQQMNDWSQHFNMGPSIFPQDNIATSMFESGTIPGEAKIGCVGELSKVSSSHDFSFLQSSARDITGETWSEDQAGNADTTAHTTYQMGSAFTTTEADYQTYNAVPTGVDNDFFFQFPTSPASSGQPFQPRSPVMETAASVHRSITKAHIKHDAFSALQQCEWWYGALVRAAVTDPIPFLFSVQWPFRSPSLVILSVPFL
jgi:hypothetical protein